MTLADEGLWSISLQLTPWEYEQCKQVAESEEITLRELFQRSYQVFLSDLEAKRVEVFYGPRVSNVKSFMFVLPSSAADKLPSISGELGVSVRVLAFTMLVRYVFADELEG